ncbi:NUDIX domain-containing protein [Bermanella marisrubri]|uniref:NUDIX hydrolase n=1 Tax=Bermanella marisrubri TaxID=207949 RepID=Q1N0C0_9GAMM|nr:NUDIX domain-containing protein [Bermanella marisrubri]EAT11597.1 NUDIX hydrolase [Oceanobacter sp. RED65] [Bermanella marisrubri]QIZ83358.1 NUDIX domain-containing protein [Bermanella marisrubri]
MSVYSAASYDFCPNCGCNTEIKEVDGLLIKACADECGFAHFNNPTPVTAIIVETDEGIVLAHNVAWPEGKYSIITGYVDPYETPQETAIRETKEELNLDAYDPVFVGHYMFEMKNQLIIGYAVKAKGNIKLNEELDDYKIISKDKLKGWDSATGQTVWDWLAMT